MLFISKAFKIHFMSWDTDLGSMSPFPLLKLHIEVWENDTLSILGGCMIVFFRLPYNTTSGENSNFKLLS